MRRSPPSWRVLLRWRSAAVLRLTPAAASPAAPAVPVVTFDSKLESDDPVSLVSTSNLGAGRLAGRHLGETLGGKGNVIMMRLHEGSASTTDREQGFMEAIAAFPGITVVSSNQTRARWPRAATARART